MYITRDNFNYLIMSSGADNVRNFPTYGSVLIAVVLMIVVACVFIVALVLWKCCHLFTKQKALTLQASAVSTKTTDLVYRNEPPIEEMEVMVIENNNKKDSGKVEEANEKV